MGVQSKKVDIAGASVQLGKFETSHNTKLQYIIMGADKVGPVLVWCNYCSNCTTFNDEQTKQNRTNKRNNLGCFKRVLKHLRK